MGENVSRMFNELDYDVGQIKWYLLSIKMQHVFGTMVISVQKAVALGGFGSIVGSRDIFQRASELN